MVTVELALGLGSLFLVLALILAALGAGTAKAVLCDQVRQEARAHSIGTGSRRAGNASISIADSGENFTVHGSKPAVRIGGWSAGMVECTITGTREATIPWLVLGGGS